MELGAAAAGLNAGSRRGRSSRVIPGWKNVGAGGMDGVGSDAGLGWGKHPSSLGYAPQDLARGVGHKLNQSKKPPQNWDQHLPWGELQRRGRARRGPLAVGPGGHGDSASARALPEAPQMFHHVFPPNICPQFPSVRARGRAGAACAAWAAWPPPSCKRRRKRLWVWGAPGPRKPLLGRRGGETLK